MNDGFRLYDDIYLAYRLPEEPFCLNHLKPFVHHGGRVDSDLRSHIPVRVLQSIVFCRFLNPALIPRPEWAARCSEMDFGNFIALGAEQALEDR